MVKCGDCKWHTVSLPAVLVESVEALVKSNQIRLQERAGLRVRELEMLVEKLYREVANEGDS